MQRLRLAAVLAVVILAACQDRTPTPLAPDVAPRLDEAKALTRIFLAPYEAREFCGGEYINLTGWLHYVQHVTHSHDGESHVFLDAQARQITGIGEVSGDRYRQVGVMQLAYNLVAATTERGITSMSIVDQETGRAYLIRYQYHMTMRPDGTVAVSFESSAFQCH